MEPESKPIYKQPIVIILTIILIGLCAFAFIGWYWGGRDDKPVSLSDDEKARILDSLRRTASDTPALSDKQKQEILNNLAKATSSSPLSDEQKIEILKTLKK